MHDHLLELWESDGVSGTELRVDFACRDVGVSEHLSNSLDDLSGVDGRELFDEGVVGHVPCPLGIQVPEQAFHFFFFKANVKSSELLLELSLAELVVRVGVNHIEHNREVEVPSHDELLDLLQGRVEGHIGLSRCRLLEGGL